MRTGRPPVPAPIRWWRHVWLDPSGCWLYLPVQKDGYAKFALTSRQMVMAHRYGYELLVGPIPQGMQLDHLCRVRNCVNPTHVTGTGPRGSNGRFTS